MGASEICRNIDNQQLSVTLKSLQISQKLLVSISQKNNTIDLIWRSVEALRPQMGALGGGEPPKGLD